MAAETQLASAQTGNFTSAVAERQRLGKPGAIVITSTVGATPTVTVNIQGSVNGVDWFNIPYALVATPTTLAIAAIVITTAVTVTYLLLVDQPWRFVRIVASANTNVTLTATAVLD